MKEECLEQQNWGYNTCERMLRMEIAVEIETK